VPVTALTCATPWLSRSSTPICEGVRPFLASLQICSVSSLEPSFSHDGGVRLYGSALSLMPLPASGARESGQDGGSVWVVWGGS
jgi:hypothetical protein